MSDNPSLWAANQTIARLTLERDAARMDLTLDRDAMELEREAFRAEIAELKMAYNGLLSESRKAITRRLK